MPAEGFKRLGHKLFGLYLRQTPILFRQINQLDDIGGENIARRQNLLGVMAQFFIFDQLKPQKGCKNPKRIAPQCRVINRTKGRRMDRHPRH